MMRKITKSLVALAMVGIMQVGFSAAVSEASPKHFHKNGHERVQFDDRHHGHDDAQREHDERMRKENERHEREMQRRHNEDERHWEERKRAEEEHHQHEVDQIAALLIGVALGSSL